MSGILSNHHKITLLGIRRHVQNMSQKMCSRGISYWGNNFCLFFKISHTISIYTKVCARDEKNQKFEKSGKFFFILLKGKILHHEITLNKDINNDILKCKIEGNMFPL